MHFLSSLGVKHKGEPVIVGQSLASLFIISLGALERANGIDRLLLKNLSNRLDGLRGQVPSDLLVGSVGQSKGEWRGAVESDNASIVKVDKGDVLVFVHVVDDLLLERHV